MVIDVVLSVIGWLLVALVLADLFRTVLWSGEGAGPLTAALTAAARRTLPPLAGRNRPLHSMIGPLALAAVVAAWAALLLVGFALVLQMDPDAVRSASSDRPADWFERAYFVGYTIFTLGNGDFVPATDLLRAITVLMNALGMLLVTLSVTYLVPVISASVGSRAFASSTAALGETAEDVVTGAWDGTRVDLDHELRSLAVQLSTLAHQHLAYPVLHLFHSSDRSSSAPLAVAELDDVLTLLDAVAPEAAPARPPRRQLRSSIEDYVKTYGPEIEPGEPAPAPVLEPLVAAGIPVVHDPGSFAATVDERGEWRGRVQNLARISGIEGR